MDITEYTRAKFEISDILRSASVKARQKAPEELYPFEDLFARLAEDRFNIAVIGQFSRGKTSLMNAMLGTDQLPTGVIPLTSVITTVQYGPKSGLRIEYEGQRLSHEAPLSDIADYVSQAKNPGNEKHIRLARVDLPAELLRNGFVLVDTPGLGSSIVENTKTTEEFLPEADAFILVTSYESPLSAEEYQLLRALQAHSYRTFLVVNKRDLVSEEDRAVADQHILRQIETIFGDQSPRLFSISARDAINVEKGGDENTLVATGVPQFVNALVDFVLNEKQNEFLRRLIGRVRARLDGQGDCCDEITRLNSLEGALFATSSRPTIVKHFSDTIHNSPGRFTNCPVCTEMERSAWDFLTRYQYDITVDRSIRAELAEAGGLCSFHTWQYAAIADTHGTCIAFPDVLDHFAALLSKVMSDATQASAMKNWRPSEATCVYCRRCSEAETAALEKIVVSLSQKKDRNYPVLCLPHLAKLCSRISVTQSFVEAQITTWNRVSEDMRRYALNRDGFRRAFSTTDELDSNIRGLRLLAGHRTLSYPPPLDR